MELNSEIVTTPLRPAATVVMLRDVAGTMEVFLLKRHGLSDVLGGAFVFAGGKVDRRDADLDMARYLDRLPTELHASLNEPELDAITAASLYVAALREVFEESGILFAQGATQLEAARAQALLRSGYSFDGMLAQLGLRLQTQSLVPWSRWITPPMPSVTNKRFDTRFFVSEVPASQVARHDNHEATDSLWLTPAEALHRYLAGQIELAPPQIMSLSHLTHFGCVAEVLWAARSRPPPVIAPEPFDQDGLRVICYPGDERHTVRERALPGPTRLAYRDKRFGPLDGTDALFAPRPVREPGN